MSLAEGKYEHEFESTPKLTEQEQAAWELYCDETEGSFSARDFWYELPDLLQELYLARV